MPVKWKTSKRFTPSLILEKINAVRTINPKGGASYINFDLHENLPVLQSMLDFPQAARNVDASTLVLKALGKVRESLTPDNLLYAINRELTEQLATREERYYLVTAASLDLTGISRSFSNSGVFVRYVNSERSVYIKEHLRVISTYRAPVPPTPNHYAWLIAEVKAKSPDSAFSKGMQAIDLQRALWCLMNNPSMSIGIGGPVFGPINVVRLGGSHTVHKTGGKSVREGSWFEPNFAPIFSHRFSKPAVVTRHSQWALKRIRGCKYGERITGALIRFVRALDQADADSAFVRLWGALEALVTPDIADYDALVRRCAFLFRDGKYHRQVLEHLREYRNLHLHGGLESMHARTHCFQLQMYFVEMVWFFIKSATTFSSIHELNEFLDQPSDVTILKKQMALSRRAIRFVSHS